MSGAVNKQTAAAMHITLFFCRSHHALEDKRTVSAICYLVSAHKQLFSARCSESSHSRLTCHGCRHVEPEVCPAALTRVWGVTVSVGWLLQCCITGLLKPTIQPKNRVGLFTLQHYLLYLPVANRANAHLHT